jgi:hypothetical protein
MDEAVQEKDRKKAEELSQKLTESETHLGPEYLALIDQANWQFTFPQCRSVLSPEDR